MKKIFIFAAIAFAFLLSVLSCSSDNPLIGEWRVVAYADPFRAINDATIVNSDEIFTLQFHADGFFSFTTDCNTISGEFAASGKKLHFLNLSATEVACDREIVERSIKCQLPMVVSYNLGDDSTLCLLGQQGNVLVKLVKAQDWKHEIAGEDDCPRLYRTDADRKPKFILTITSDSLLSCRNNFSGKDEIPLILDTTNPGFAEFVAKWINSLDSVQADELMNTQALHITVGTGVSDVTVDKVRMVLRNCGVERLSVSNFDIEE